VKTLVIGAHGKIGRILCRKAAGHGLELRAMLRSEAQQQVVAGPGVEPVVGDLEGEFAHAFEGCDRVVFTAGSGGQTGGDKTLLVDLYGAIRAIEASEARGIEHFVMVSALRVDRPLSAPAAMRHYFVAKKLADERLLASSVPATILRPGRLTDERGSGRIASPVASAPGIDVSRENVADCIAASLREPRARGRIVELLDGETAIAELFSALP
jgi:uncharacterized protein YbjT (DUF2867 family)